MYGAFTLLFAVFASSASAQTRPRGEEPPPPAMSLIEAIDSSARKIVEDLPKGSRIAVYTFASRNHNIGEFVMDELTGALIEQGLEVVDRRNLPYLRREFEFHMSGEVSEESIVRIGQFVGANMVITGDLSGAGDVYRYNIKATHLETSTYATSIRLNVRNDEATQRMLAHIIDDPRSEHTVLSRMTDEFRDSIEKSPHTPGMFFDRGVMRSSRGQFEPAVEDLTKTLELKPEMTSTYMVRGNAHLGAGNFEKAMEDFDRVVQTNPRDALVLASRGVTWYRMGHLDQSITDLDSAFNLAPQQDVIREALARTHVARGMMYREYGEFERAMTDLEIALTLNPNNAEAQEVLAWLRQPRRPVQRYRLTVNSSPSRGGTVVVTPDLPLYDARRPVTLSAVPEVGFVFDGWTGAPILSRKDNVTITITRDLNVTANFRPVSIDSHLRTVARTESQSSQAVKQSGTRTASQPPSQQQSKPPRGVYMDLGMGIDNGNGSANIDVPNISFDDISTTFLNFNTNLGFSLIRGVPIYVVGKADVSMFTIEYGSDASETTWLPSLGVGALSYPLSRIQLGTSVGFGIASFNNSWHLNNNTSIRNQGPSSTNLVFTWWDVSAAIDLGRKNGMKGWMFGLRYCENQGDLQTSSLGVFLKYWVSSKNLERSRLKSIESPTR